MGRKKAREVRETAKMHGNLDFTEWGDAFPNRLLGAATLDRLRHNAYRVVLESESYRRPKPLPGTAAEGAPSPGATARTTKGRRKQISTKGCE